MAKQLIVIDGQIDFDTGALPNPNFHAKLGYVSDAITNAELPVVYTADTHDKDYMETLEGKKLPVPHCIKGTEGHKIIPALLNAATKLKRIHLATLVGRKSSEWQTTLMNLSLWEL